MNFSHATFLTVLLRRICGLVLIWVLSALPLSMSALNSPQRPGTLSPAKTTAEYNPGRGHYRGPRTYLAMLGPTPIRFAEGQPQLPPEPVPPTLPTPKQPTLATESAKTPAAVTDPVPAPLAVTITTPENTNPMTGTLPSSNLKPVSILPDDTKREIRAEDVLPFFQFPGAPESGAVAVPFTTSQPRGTTAPPSSASYKQQ